MARLQNLIPAPAISPLTLWNMQPEEFNDWRRKNDYPRIVNCLKNKLDFFPEWMEKQGINEKVLLTHQPGIFLGDEDVIYINTIRESDDSEKEIISFRKNEINQAYGNKGLVTAIKEITPYPVWVQRSKKCKPRFPEVNMVSGSSHIVLDELELLNLGNCTIANIRFGNRNLDFVNISHLKIKNVWSTNFTNIWFSSALNLEIEGNLTFINAYYTRFSFGLNDKSNSLKLLNGRYQDWHLKECDIELIATNATLHRWKVNAFFFSAILNNTDLMECSFEHATIYSPVQIGFARTFHAHLKQLYSQIGKRHDANIHFFEEKKLQRRSYLHLRENYRDMFLKSKRQNKLKWLKLVFFFRYLRALIAELVWGYGERPFRTIYTSLLVIWLFSVLYFFSNNLAQELHQNYMHALSYSFLTFTTLGYGDVKQSTELLKLITGIEALFGITLWSLLIAGFTNNSKDY